MCWSAYIASDVVLPSVPWVDDAPAFHVENGDPETVAALRVALKKPHVYFVGAHGGCSCDFTFTLVPPEDDVDRAAAAASRQARNALADYLAAAVRSGPVEFIAGWMGEENLPALRHATVTPDHFRPDDFGFEGRLLLTVERRSAAT